MWEDFQGSRYSESQSLGLREIAKLVRTDVKTEIPHRDVVVRIKRKAKEKWLVMFLFNCEPFSAVDYKLTGKLEEIANRYNRRENGVEQYWTDVNVMFDSKGSGRDYMHYEILEIMQAY